MNFFKFFIAFFSTFLLIYLCNKTWIIKSTDAQKSDTQTPRFGAFLSPSTGFWQNAEGALPSLKSNIANDKLKGKVSISYDERLVPHIFAENTHDAFFAQGYVTASLRLWQMEFQTHVAAGRLSEIIGNTIPASINMDLEIRRSGLPRAAKAAAELWKTDTTLYSLLESYTAGVNAYIASLHVGNYPLEYKLLDYAPEPWSIYKTALLLKYLAKDLTSRDEDFHATNAYQLLGKEVFNKLYPEYFPEQSPIIQDTVWAFENVNIDLKKDTNITPILLSENNFYEYPFTQPAKHLGSNNWAVSAQKTKHKKPILCNDPHLLLSFPSIWFELQIHTPEFNVYGVSLPGAPAIISGFNENVAWGVTNVAHDVRDWYEIQWKDANKKEYLLDGKYVAAEYIYDTLFIKGSSVLVDTLIYTHWGPIAHKQNGKDLALRWIANLPSWEPLTFIGLNKAKNYADYKAAIAHYACPAQNIVFADIHGDIAITAQGKLPIRKANQGKFIQAGNSTALAWSEFIPQSHLPQEYNPTKGFVGSANQHTTNPSYPYYYYGYFEEYRGRHLNEKLAAMSNITVEDMMLLQNDNYSVRGRDFMPLLMKYLRRGELSKDELELLVVVQQWNYIYDKDSIAPSIFETWMQQLSHTVYDEILAANAKAQYNKKNEILLPEEWTLLHLLKRDTLNPIFDILETKDTVETIHQTVTESFRRTCKVLGKVTELKTWRDYKATNIMHLARIQPFSKKNMDVSGHGSALNAMTPTNGPSWRMIVELGGKAYGVYPGGQSGNIGSRFYNSMLEKWSNGQYYELQVFKTKEESMQNSLFQQNFYQ